MTKADLERVRDWAIEKLTTGNEPPWSWYQLMKLREASEAILAGMEVTQPTAGLRGLEPHQGGGLRLVDSGCPPSTSPLHQDKLPVRLPM
jgi:hypothetical protein